MAAYVHVNSSKYVVLNGYVGSELSYRKLYRGYIGDENNYAHLAYCATTQTTTTQYTSAIDSSGLSSTTALTCESTSGESYITRESTSGESYVMGTVPKFRISYKNCITQPFYYTTKTTLSTLPYKFYSESKSVSGYGRPYFDQYTTWDTLLINSDANYTGSDAIALGSLSQEKLWVSNGCSSVGLSYSSKVSSRYATRTDYKWHTYSGTQEGFTEEAGSFLIFNGIDCLKITDYATFSASDYWQVATTKSSTAEGSSYIYTYDKTYWISNGYGNKVNTTFKVWNTSTYNYSSNSTQTWTWEYITHQVSVNKHIWLEGFGCTLSNPNSFYNTSLYLTYSQWWYRSTTSTEYLTRESTYSTEYLTRESTSAYSGVTTATTIGPAPIPEPSTDGKHILFLGKNNGRSGLFSNDCGLTWETVTNIFPEFDDGSTYAVQKTAFKLVWHSGYFYFLRVVSKQKYSYSSNYYHWLDIHRIKDDLTGTSEQVLAPYELEYIGNTPTSASVILSTAEAISGTIYLSAKVNNSTVLELDFDALSVVAAVYQTGSVETIRYLPDTGLIGMRNYKLGLSSGNTYNWVFKDILSSSPIAIFPVQYSGSAQMYFTLLDSAHSPGLVHSRDTLLQANWTNAAGGSSKIGYFVDESGTTSFNEISGLGSIIFQDMGTGSNSWIDENFFAYQFGDYLVYSIYKDKAVYVVSNFGSNSPTRTVLFGGTNSGPSLGCVCKDRIILTRNRNIYTVDLANVSSTQVASNVISFSDDSCCFCVNTQHGNCLK